MLSMKGIAIAAGVAIAGVVAVIASSASNSAPDPDLIVAAAAGNATRDDGQPDVNCTAGGWIRSMTRAGDGYNIELADGTTGHLSDADAKQMCGEG